MTDSVLNPRELFFAALEKPAADRAVFLAGVDPALRARVEELLDAHEASGSFLKPAEPTGGETVTQATPNPPAAIQAEETLAHEAGAAPAASPAPKGEGRLLHYQLQEVLGRGGFGTVYRAFDEKLHRVVAVKQLAPELAAQGAARQRFLREARAAAAVRHEHVIAIYAVDEEPLPHLVMEFISGKTLQQKIDQDGALTTLEILRIGSQVAVGLAAAHQQGLIHRDIKPSNILLENGVERVKISDFGLARAVDDASISQSGIIAGTPMYMSPEQAEGKQLDHRSDLFSLGSTLYALCTGHAPFRASSTLAVLRRVAEEEPRPLRDANPAIPAWLAAIVSKLMAKRPEERFATAKEVADLLLAHLAHEQQPGTTPRPELVRLPASPQASLRWQVWLLAAAAPATLAILGNAIVWWTGGSGDPFLEPFTYVVGWAASGAILMAWMASAVMKRTRNRDSLPPTIFRRAPEQQPGTAPEPVLAPSSSAAPAGWFERSSLVTWFLVILWASLLVPFIWQFVAHAAADAKGLAASSSPILAFPLALAAILLGLTVYLVRRRRRAAAAQKAKSRRWSWWPIAAAAPLILAILVRSVVLASGPESAASDMPLLAFAGVVGSSLILLVWAASAAVVRWKHAAAPKEGLAAADLEKLQGKWEAVRVNYRGGPQLGPQALPLTWLQVEGRKLRLHLPGLSQNVGFDVSVVGLSRKLVLDSPAQTETFVVEQFVDYQLMGETLRLTLNNPQPEVADHQYRAQGLPIPAPANRGLEIELRRDPTKAKPSRRRWVAVGAVLLAAILLVMCEQSGVTNFSKLLTIFHHELTLLLPDAETSVETWETDDQEEKPLSFSLKGRSGRFAPRGVIGGKATGTATEQVRLPPGNYWLFVKRRGATIDRRLLKIGWGGRRTLTIQDEKAQAEDLGRLQGQWEAVGVRYLDGPRFGPEALPLTSLELKGDRQRLMLPGLDYSTNFQVICVGDQRWLQLGGVFSSTFQVKGPIGYVMTEDQLTLTIEAEQLPVADVRRRGQGIPETQKPQRGLEITLRRKGEKGLSPEQALARLRGRWLPAGSEMNGKPVPIKNTRAPDWIEFGADEFRFSRAGQAHSIPLKLNLRSEPIELDFEIEPGLPVKCILKAEGDRLTMAMGLADEPRPTTFTTTPGAKAAVVTYVRAAGAEQRPADAAPPAAPAEPVWTQLFDGKTLAGWTTLPQQKGNWRVEDSMLVGSGPGATSHLFSERGDYENFHLRAQARINFRGKDKLYFGNSGIYFRAGKNFETLGRYPKGYEAQIFVGDRTPNDAHTEKNRTGSLHGLVPYEKLVPGADAGEWFTLEILAQGNRLTILVNGMATVDNFQDGRFSRGHLALQQIGEDTIIQFRKIEIAELPSDGAAAPAPVKLTDFETKLLAAINRERAKAKAPPLTAEARLTKAARTQADDMARWGAYENEREGRGVEARLNEVGYAHTWAVEFLAAGHPDPEAALNFWLSMEEGRKTLIDPRYTEAGLGTGRDEKGKPWYSVMAAAPAKPTKLTKLTDFEVKLLEAINRERAKVQAPPLVAEARLARAARAHADDMARWGRLEHVIDGKDLEARLKEAGYAYAACGENIALNQRDAEETLAAWAQSEGHRQNVLNPKHTEAGLGTARDAKGQAWHAVIFAAPARKPAASAPEPKTKP